MRCNVRFNTFGLFILFVAPITGCHQSEPIAPAAQNQSVTEANEADRELPNQQQENVLAQPSDHDEPSNIMTDNDSEDALPQEDEATNKNSAVDDSESDENNHTVPDSVVATTMAPMNQEEERPKAYRLYLPTTVGILLADVEILIDSVPLDEAYAQRLDSIIEQALGEQALDEQALDEQETLSWEMLFELVSSDPKQFGQNRSVNANQYRQMTQFYDRNRNGQPDREEVSKFLFRNSGFAGAFRLSGTDFHRYDNRSRSNLFKVLDRDGNGSLSNEELENASSTLIELDENSDRSLDFAEAGIDQGDDNPAWISRRINRRGEVAMDLEGFVDWSMISYSLDANREPPLGIEEHITARLDANDDQTISDEEAKQLGSSQSDFRFRINFSSTGDPTLTVLDARPELGKIVQNEHPSSMARIDGDSLNLVLSASETRTRSNQVPAEVFAMLDGNDDGLLDKDEIPDAAPDEFSIEQLDQNQDGKLSLEEINSVPRGVEPYWNMQVRGRAAEFPDGVFAVLDENRDLILTEREIRHASETLSLGSPTTISPTTISPDSIRDTFLIQIGRGDPSQDRLTFLLQPNRQSESKSVPAWAKAMDVNGDHEISAEEFIGTPQQFSALDVNGDGFASIREVLQFSP